MSPLGYAKNQDGTSFPRVSGDEPLIVAGVTWYIKFSPRERG